MLYEVITNISNEISDIYYKIEDAVYELSSKKENYSYDPANLDLLIERSELIEKLKRKYGNSIQGIRDYYTKTKNELNLITFSSQEFEKLSKQLDELIV